MNESTFRIGIKYNPSSPYEKVDINNIIRIIHSLDDIKIRKFIDNLFIIFHIKSYDYDVKIRIDGIIVIYSIHNPPLEYEQIKKECIDLISTSKSVLNYLKFKNVVRYDLKDSFQFICHGLNNQSTNLNYFINSILNIFGKEKIDNLYVREGSAIISNLYPPHSLRFLGGCERF